MIVPQLQLTPTANPEFTLRDNTGFVKAIDKIDAGHIQAIQERNKIDEAVSKLASTLDPQHQEYIYSKANEVKAAIDAAAYDGNYHTAVGEAMLQASKFMQDPELMDRIKFNTDYNTEKEKVLNDPNITQRAKNYWIKHNSGEYVANRDENGNFLNGIKYEPTFRPAQYVDAQEIFDKIRANLKPLGATSDRIYWDTGSKDALGNTIYTDNPNEAAPGSLPMYQTVSGWQGVTKDRIKQALKTGALNNPELLASLQQEYNIDLDEWKEHQNDSDDAPVFLNAATDKNGILLSFDKVLDRLVDEYATTHVEGISTRETNILDGMKYHRETSPTRPKNNNGNEYLDPSNLGNLSTENAAIIKTEVENIGVIGDRIKSNENQIRNLLTESFGISRDEVVNLRGQDLFDKAQETISKSNLNSKQKAELSYNLSNIVAHYNYDKSSYDNILEGATDRVKNAANYITGIDTDGSIDLNTKFGRQYANSVNNIFGDNETVSFIFDDPTDAQLFYNNISSGIDTNKITRPSQNSNRIVIGKDAANNLNYIIREYDKLDNDTKNKIRVLNPTQEHRHITPTAGYSLSSQNVMTVNDTNAMGNSSSMNIKSMHTISKNYDKANKRLTDYSSERYIGQPITTSPFSTAEGLIQAIEGVDFSKNIEHTDNYKKLQFQLYENAGNYNGINMYSGDNPNQLTLISDEDRAKNINIIRDAVRNNRATITMGWVGDKIGPIVTVPGYSTSNTKSGISRALDNIVTDNYKDSKKSDLPTITYFLEGFADDGYESLFRENPILQGVGDLYSKLKTGSSNLGAINIGDYRLNLTADWSTPEITYWLNGENDSRQLSTQEAGLLLGSIRNFNNDVAALSQYGDLNSDYATSKLIEWAPYADDQLKHMTTILNLYNPDLTKKDINYIFSKFNNLEMTDE